MHASKDKSAVSKTPAKIHPHACMCPCHRGVKIRHVNGCCLHCAYCDTRIANNFAAGHIAECKKNPITEDAQYKALLARREKNKLILKKMNHRLLAGSPMYFYCAGCDAEIRVPESHTKRPIVCTDCADLYVHLAGKFDLFLPGSGVELIATA